MSDQDSNQKKSSSAETASHASREKASAPDSKVMHDADAFEGLMPESIGPYVIKHRIGRGGMGIVYLGIKQEGNFTRRAAVKVMRRGIDTEDVLKRFQLERQVLASLNHPHIARLYDGGETEDGRPYFAMEFIEGLPIDQYCDRQTLNVEVRLRLFLKICSAIQYAHRNLIVHRDLKPENIVVTPQGEPKLLDFGIAKLVNPDLSSAIGAATAPDQRLMTPEYASPEQVRGEPITTSTDVYSLGVVLFELLTGHRPYRIKERVRAEIERVILEEEPERPSTAINRVEERPMDVESRKRTGKSTTTITPETVSKTREGKPERLRRRLAGDIDTIVLKAMRKEPSHRYDSVEQFASDIERHLSGQPVLARPHSPIYRLRKFIRRNRAGVSIAVLMVTAVALGTVAIMNSLAREADRVRANAAELQTSLEFERAEKLKQSLDRFQNRFANLLTEQGSLIRDIAPLRGATDIRERLAKASLNTWLGLSEDFPEDDPEQRQKYLFNLANAYRELGEIQGGVRNPSTGQLDAAISNYNDGLKCLDQVLVINAGNIDAQKGRVSFFTNLGDLQFNQKDYNNARDNYQNAAQNWLLIDADLLDEDRRMSGVVEMNVGKGCRGIGDLESALEHYLIAKRIREPLSSEFPDNDFYQRDLSVTYSWLAGAYSDNNNLAESIRYDMLSLDIREAQFNKYPENNRQARDVATANYLLGNKYLKKVGDTLQGRKYLIAASNLFLELATDSPNDARARRDLELGFWSIVDLYDADQDHEAALAQFNRYGKLYQAFLETSPDNHDLQSQLATTHQYQGRMHATLDSADPADEHYQESESLLRSLLTVESFSDEDLVWLKADLALTLTLYADLLSSQGNNELATSKYQEAVGLFEEAKPTELDDEELIEAFRRARDAIE
ncbi:MAG: protein kinase [Planctomycetota bacterium]|nr:protein kinase [Planctomycetota bacterium]